MDCSSYSAQTLAHRTEDSYHGDPTEPARTRSMPNRARTRQTDCELIGTFLQVRDAPLGHDGDPGAHVRPLPLHPGLVQNLSTEPQVNRVRARL